MDNVVTMSLEEYTKLVIENANLKSTLNGLKNKAIHSAYDEIKTDYIEKINSIETAENALQLPLNKLLSEYTSGYSWKWHNIADESYGILNANEIKELVASEIRKLIKEKYSELKEDENNG